MQSSILESNEAAGTRLELLLFRLNGPQLYGINVFKVQAVQPHPALASLPGVHPLVLGVARLRGMTMPVMDLSEGIQLGPLQARSRSHVVISEYNRSVHGFLVQSVDRIAHTEWDSVHPPPSGMGGNHFLSAVTLMGGELVQIIDVEKVLDQVVHASTSVRDELVRRRLEPKRRILVVDDSRVARRQVEAAMAQIGVECETAVDGRQALERIEALHRAGTDPAAWYDMVISDIEMPNMDGYMLVTALRHRTDCRNLYVLLHSSISGEFNVDMVRRTGANRFIQKYCPDELAEAVVEQLRAQEAKLAEVA